MLLFKNLFSRFKHFNIVIIFMQQLVDAPNDVRLQPLLYFRLLIINEIYLSKLGHSPSVGTML